MVFVLGGVVFVLVWVLGEVFLVAWLVWGFFGGGGVGCLKVWYF